ncbi:hypothetical protein [Bacillus wiedmannii]|uniref:hypothetical protein n=1 Tax=Bacillus wiedmannii TaxID=1890302 RepID=UPI000BF15E65|nr:hypothetical protein [Bacillus wiedmannii]PEM08547.1 hypothetical protein CN610_20050 [Bacillus wiedmannii]
MKKIELVHEITTVVGFEEINKGMTGNLLFKIVNQGTLKLWGFDKINNFMHNLKFDKEAAIRNVSKAQLESILIVAKQVMKEEAEKAEAEKLSFNPEDPARVLTQEEYDTAIQQEKDLRAERKAIDEKAEAAMWEGNEVEERAHIASAEVLDTYIDWLRESKRITREAIGKETLQQWKEAYKAKQK